MNPSSSMINDKPKGKVFVLENRGHLLKIKKNKNNP